MAKPTDEEILDVLRPRGTLPTYVIANWLSDSISKRDTSFVLRRLKAMEKAGKVERVPSPYAVMICWRAAEQAEVKP